MTITSRQLEVFFFSIRSNRIKDLADPLKFDIAQYQRQFFLFFKFLLLSNNTFKYADH